MITREKAAGLETMLISLWVWDTHGSDVCYAVATLKMTVMCVHIHDCSHVLPCLALPNLLQYGDWQKASSAHEQLGLEETISLCRSHHNDNKYCSRAWKKEGRKERGRA